MNITDYQWSATNSTFTTAHTRNTSTITNITNITIFASWTVPYMKNVYSTIGGLAFLLNILVVSIFLAFRKSLSKQQTTSASNVHIFWQSCVDATIGLLLLLNMLLEDDGTPRYTMGNALDEMICRLWNSKVIVSAAMDLSVLGVLLLNFERYMAIVHPILHRTKFVQSRAISVGLMLSTIVLTVVFRSSFGILTCRILSDRRCAAFIDRVSPSYQVFMGISTFLLNYVVPFAGVVFFYSSMAFKLHLKITPGAERAREEAGKEEKNFSNPEQNPEMLKARNNVLKTSALLSACFVLCWTTNQFYRILYYFGIIPLGGFLSLYYFSVSMVFANSCMNPFIYCIKYKPFQQCIGAVYVGVRKRIRNIFKI